ncbi:hypothetical protein PLESTM_001817800 [Pleodorina starrii]|nr:hypothetical protein PLESTM_001817800 [Pleodorina starrii]
MAQPPALPLAQMDSELDFRPVELIPLTQLRDGAEALLAMEVSDDLMPLGLQAGEKPAVPLGADDLVAYYEKQLAATQLVQHRLQQQFNQLAEEKVALETSLSVQTAALQQQLVLAREKADRALAQAEQAQQLVHDAHAAVGEIVGAVTQLAELLDVAGASNELSHSFEAVAHSTQRTFQAVAAAQEGTQVVLEFQLEARDACQVSPLLTAGSVGSQRDAEHRTSLEGEAARLRQELEEAKRRSNDLEAEMHAAQLLFTGLEAEVVSLQHDQAQAAAKLQVSQEELIAARDQLLAARQALTAAESPEANLLNQGLVKLDAHLSTIRSFIESLSMPQPASVVDASSGDTLQLRVGRSPDGASRTRYTKLRDGHDGLTSVQMADLAAERDRLHSRVTELELHVTNMEIEQESMVRQHTQHMSMAAAAGAAGAAAAVAVVSDAAASTAPPSPSQSSSMIGPADSANTADSPAVTGTRSRFSARALAALEQRAIMTEAALATMAAEREAAIQRVVSLEEEVEALHELLLQNAQERDGALQQSAAGRAVAGGRRRNVEITPLAKLKAPAPAVTVDAADALAGQPSDAPLTGSPPSPSAMPPLSRRRSGRSDNSHVSDSATLDEADDLFLEQGEPPRHEMSRAYSRSSAGVNSSYQSFTSEAPLVPLAARVRRYTECSEPHTYPLDPTEPLEALFPSTGVGGPASSLRAGDACVRRAHQRTSGGDADMQSLLAEVQQLQTAVCGLIVSKAIACTELQAEFDTRVTALQVLHDAELAQLRAERPQACAAALANAPSSQAAPRLDKSTRVSEDGLVGSQYESELLQHTVSLEVRIGEMEEGQQQLVSNYEGRLQQLKADHEARLADLVARQQEAEAAEGVRQAELGAVQESVEHFRQHCAQLEVRIAELREQHAAELRAYGVQLTTQHSERCAELQADKAAELEKLAVRHEDEKARLQAAHEEQLAQLRLTALQREELEAVEREARDKEVAALRDLISELNAQLAQQHGEREAALTELGALHQARLAEEIDRQQSAAEEIRRSLEEHEGDLLMRESLIAELQGQLQQLQGEKELEEQSLQSLMSTKAWMTEEIRSLQASLKEATTKLAVVETDLAASRSAGLSALAARDSGRSTDSGATPARRGSNDAVTTVQRAAQRGTFVSGGLHEDGAAQADRANSIPGALLPSPGAEASRVDAAISLAADQLAEAAMQAALAEARLEALQSHQAGSLPGDGFGAATAEVRPPSDFTLEQTTLMMETVVLQGELDELRGKHRALQSRLEVVADELAYAVLRASLAELQLEELRLQRASGVAKPRVASPRPNQQSCDHQTATPARSAAAAVLGAAQMAGMAAPCASPGLVAFTPSKPDELLSSGDVLDHFGTDAFVPIQQARQLYRELRAVRRALGDLMVTDAVANCAASREALSSVWEAVITAQEKAANVARTLQQQQEQKRTAKHGSQGAGGSFSGEEQSADETRAGPYVEGWQHTEIARVRDAYRDACDVYEMLRSDAEDINSQLWRLNLRLHQQLSAKEQELTRAQAGAVPGQQLALESLLSKKEAYVRSVEGQVSELQVGLQSAHARLLQREDQVAALQDMLVQLTEQLTVFESVVVRCEVLSADLVSKSAVQCS